MLDTVSPHSDPLDDDAAQLARASSRCPRHSTCQRRVLCCVLLPLRTPTSRRPLPYAEANRQQRQEQLTQPASPSGAALPSPPFPFAQISLSSAAWPGVSHPAAVSYGGRGASSSR